MYLMSSVVFFRQMVGNGRPRERQVDFEILQIALRSVLLLRIESISNNENKSKIISDCMKNISVRICSWKKC